MIATAEGVQTDEGVSIQLLAVRTGRNGADRI